MFKFHSLLFNLLQIIGTAYIYYVMRFLARWGNKWLEIHDFAAVHLMTRGLDDF